MTDVAIYEVVEKWIIDSGFDECSEIALIYDTSTETFLSEVTDWVLLL